MPPTVESKHNILNTFRKTCMITMKGFILFDLETAMSFLRLLFCCWLVCCEGQQLSNFGIQPGTSPPQLPQISPAQPLSIAMPIPVDQGPLAFPVLFRSPTNNQPEINWQPQQNLNFGPPAGRSIPRGGYLIPNEGFTGNLIAPPGEVTAFEAQTVSESPLVSGKEIISKVQGSILPLYDVDPPPELKESLSTSRTNKGQLPLFRPESDPGKPIRGPAIVNGLQPQNHQLAFPNSFNSNSTDDHQAAIGQTPNEVQKEINNESPLLTAQDIQKSDFVSPPPLTDQERNVPVNSFRSDGTVLDSDSTLQSKSEGGSSETYSSASYSVKRAVEDTSINCLENLMTITFKFSTPFSGWIYPYNHFKDCLLFVGSNHRSAVLTLHHGFCANLQPNSTEAINIGVGPFIEHHLMVQWEPEFVSEDDKSVIVRCEKPENFNRTISWNLGSSDLPAIVKASSHPGPQMWMQIVMGTGPSAPPLSTEIVHVGDVLTIVFNLADSIFWFDSNILSCYAFDGSGEKQRIEWEGTGNVKPKHTYSGQMLVVENGCSTKPKLFSHFFKQRSTNAEGVKTTQHFAHFKAFRFPTSVKIQVECDVEVCYKECRSLPLCSTGFQPQSFFESEGNRRVRRAADESSNPDKPHELDRVNFRRTIEVHLKDGLTKDSGPPVLSGSSAPNVTDSGLDCYTPKVFYGTVITLAVCVLVQMILLLACTFRSTRVKPVVCTPSRISPSHRFTSRHPYRDMLH